MFNIFRRSLQLYTELEIDVKLAQEQKSAIVWDKTQQKIYTTKQPNLDQHIIIHDCRPYYKDLYSIYNPDNITMYDIQIIASIIDQYDPEGFKAYLQKK
jgi:hypothetical protein